MLLGRRYVADLTVLLMSYLNRLERLLRRLSAGLGTEVSVPPNQPFVSSPIAAAPVVDPIALVPVLPLRIILPTGSASAGLLLLRRVRPALVPNVVERNSLLFCLTLALHVTVIALLVLVFFIACYCLLVL